MPEIVTLNDLSNDKAYTYASMLRKYKDKINEIITSLNEVINGIGDINDTITNLSNLVDSKLPISNVKMSVGVSSNEVDNNTAVFPISPTKFILEPNCIYELSANGDYEQPSTILFLLTGDNENPCITTLPYLILGSPDKLVNIVIEIIPNYEDNVLTVQSKDSIFTLRDDDVLGLRKIIKLEV